MKYSAWGSIKAGWPGLALWQKVVIVMFFPVFMLFLTIIAWENNYYVRHHSEEE